MAQLSKARIFIIANRNKQEMDVDITCPNCSKEYLDNNPPRLLTCGHTYCHLCLVSLAQEHENSSLLCPEDQQKILLPAGVDHLPKNIALLRLIQCHKKNSSNNSSASLKDVFFDVSKITRQEECQEDLDAQQLISAIQRGAVRKESELLTDDLPEIEIANKQIHIPNKTNVVKPNQKKQEVELCLLHQRPIEVVCMYDFERLCSKCALFGQHKGHEFKSVEEIDRQNHRSYQQIVTIFDQKEKLIEHVTNKTIEKEIINVLGIKTTTLKKQITQKFKKLAEELAKTQKNIYKKLDQASNILSQRIRSNLQIDRGLYSFYESWELKALEIIREGQKLSNEGQIAFYLKGGQLYKEGKELIKQLQNAQDAAQEQTLKIIEEFTIRFHESEYYQSLSNLVHVFEKGKEEEEKKSEMPRRLKENQATHANREKVEQTKRNQVQKHESDESLLQFGDAETESLAGSMSHSQILNESFISTKDEVIIKNKEHPGRALVKKNKSTFTAKQRVLTNKEIVNPPTMSRDDIKKKLKMFKVPEKYEKVLEGIITDSLETVDLTNAQLGDTQIIKILDLMKTNTKVRAIKLIRNKLTDQGVAMMLPFFTNLTTINLSQNQLTENTLSLLADSKANIPLLKNVVLSQTKIVQRKSKPIIERLKKLQICVSV